MTRGLDDPKSAPRPLGRIAGHVFFGLVLLAATAWSETALYVQLTGATRILALAALALALAASGGLFLRFRQRGAGWAALALTAAAVGLWYGTIQPRQDRDWAADVAHGVSPTVSGDSVTLNYVRNFRWKDDQTANAAWETRRYDLGKLSGIDVLTSVWGNPDIAHLLVSFGFADGQHVVFSVEIRREANESYSVLGGFFRQFEMVLIAADEADIIKLRTNYRNEDVHLYPMNLTKAQMRALFLSYVELGVSLAREPAFYNTITANCTSTVYRLAKVVTPDLPIDMRLLKSGQLPEYLDELGALKGAVPMSERRRASAITALARAAPAGVDFSRAIRPLP